MGVPIVVFRTEAGEVKVLLDRCPHRGVPLSFGTVTGNSIRCGYHGWRFDGDGRIVEIPGLLGEIFHPARCVTAFRVCERQGFVWAWMDPTTEPSDEPFEFRLASNPSYTTIRTTVEAPGSIPTVAENTLNVLRTSLRGRDAERIPIDCVVERSSTHAQVEFRGEPMPEGIIARLLTSSAGAVTHVDRFILPSTLEFDYRLGEDNHILVNAACTPVAPDITLLHAVVSVRSRLPGFLLRPLLEPLAVQLLSQDADVFDAHTSSETELLGPHIAQLLAPRSTSAPPLEPIRREVRMTL